MNETKTFDCNRNEFMPYGLTCERWEPQLMPRFDRHNEIEINFFPSSSVSYLFSGQVVDVPPHRLTVFWGLVPHKIIHFDGDDKYFVCTIPLSTILEWKLPESMMRHLFEGRMLTDSDDKDYDSDKHFFNLWNIMLGDSLSERSHEIVLLEMHARLLRFSMNYTVLHHQISEAENCLSHGKIHSNEVDIVSKLAIYIAQNYMHSISVTDIGRAVGVHPDYGNVLFRKAFGCTLHNYLIQERISHVERLLITTDLPITEIAYSCGFNTISRFNAAFMRVNGCTPREYRNIQSQPL